MSKGPIRVTIATENPFGGAGVHTAALADFLAAAGDVVHLVIAPDRASNPNLPVVMPTHGEVRVTGPLELDSPRSRQRALVTAVRSTAPDVILVAKGAPVEGGIAMDFALRRRAPLVWFEHDARPLVNARPRWAGWRPSLGLHKQLPIWVSSLRPHLVARVVTNSNSTRRKLVQFYGMRVDEVVPLGIDLGRFVSRPPMWTREKDRVRLGLVSRPDPWMKGLDCAFAAISEVAQASSVPIEVVFPVAREHWERIEGLIATHGATSWIRLLPPVPDAEMPALYASLDALVVASRDEGGPYTMLESMACGTPVIATPVGLVPEVIEDGVNGIRVGATDSVPALVEALRRFLAMTPEARDAMRGRTRAVIAANHDAEGHFARLREILHEVARQ